MKIMMMNRKLNTLNYIGSILVIFVSYFVIIWFIEEFFFELFFFVESYVLPRREEYFYE